MVTPIGMLAPLPDVFLVMAAEVVTILGAETVLRSTIIVVVAIVRAPVLILIVVVAIVRTPVLILRSTAIISVSVLSHS